MCEPAAEGLYINTPDIIKEVRWLWWQGGEIVLTIEWKCMNCLLLLFCEIRGDPQLTSRSALKRRLVIRYGERQADDFHQMYSQLVRYCGLSFRVIDREVSRVAHELGSDFDSTVAAASRRKNLPHHRTRHRSGPSSACPSHSLLFTCLRAG